MRLRLRMMYIIMGTPIMGVIALMGITPDEIGRTLMSEQSNAITAPHSAVAGSRTTWLEDFSASRAM